MLYASLNFEQEEPEIITTDVQYKVEDSKMSLVLFLKKYFNKKTK